MYKKKLVILGSVVVLLFGFKGIKAEELKMKPYLYIQDFEKIDPVKYWGSVCVVENIDYTINFKGLTAEKAFSGKKSFKIDITLKKDIKENFRLRIGIPFISTIKVPVEGKLNFSGRILIGEKTTDGVGLGVSCIFPPTRKGSDLFFVKLGPTNGEWKLVEGDLVKVAKKKANSKAKFYIWGATGENVGIYLHNIGFSLTKKGTRVVVYIDDIKVEGEVPTKEAYQEEIKKRWAPIKERTEKQIASWEKSLREIYQSLDSLEEEERKEIKERLEALAEKIDKIKKRGYISTSRDEWKKINSLIKGIEDDVKLETFF